MYKKDLKKIKKIKERKIVIFQRLPADLNPADKSNVTLWWHLFFLISDPMHVGRWQT